MYIRVVLWWLPEAIVFPALLHFICKPLPLAYNVSYNIQENNKNYSPMALWNKFKTDKKVYSLQWTVDILISPANLQLMSSVSAHKSATTDAPVHNNKLLDKKIVTALPSPSIILILPKPLPNVPLDRLVSVPRSFSVPLAAPFYL